MKGMLDPEFEEKVIGEAVIRETFKVSKVGTIGGFMVINGKVTRDSKVRVIRDGVVIYDGELASLKHYKDDVKEVTNGREGGLMIDGYNDIKTDDVIEAYVMEEINDNRETIANLTRCQQHLDEPLVLSKACFLDSNGSSSSI